ncbi:MAG: ArsA family ATPase [Desulfurococcales archaeon]|nr:ArsA family ATPase [Desulfurococcales archaeon]MCE4605077.1 ArsA family ATPase [Desulfurococcales archaeon]
MTLEDLIEVVRGKGGKPHIVIVIGKGGVGKTTVSIMLGDLLSRSGKTLIVSLDQAKHLVKYLSLKDTHKVTRIDGGLHAVQFDLEKESRKFTAEYSRLLKQIMPGLKVLNVEKAADTIKNSPGFEEEVYLRYLETLYSNRDFDYIVVDTPPTGVTLRILNLPRTYMFWLGNLIELRTKIASLKYSISRVMGEKAEAKDPVLDKLYELRDRYQTLMKNLVDDSRTSYVLVATPEPLPVYEVEKTVHTLQDLGASVTGIVVNRIIEDEMAKRLGVYEVQRDSIGSILNLKCKGSCIRVGIMMNRTPPDTLEKAREAARKTISLAAPLP